VPRCVCEGKQTSRSMVCGMALIILEILCIFGCVFLLYVLAQWVRDSKHQTARRKVSRNRTDVSQQRRRSKVVTFPGKDMNPNQAQAEPRPLRSKARKSTKRPPQYGDRERIAYERIARSLVLKNKS
jgi:hypothetical protein